MASELNTKLSLSMKMRVETMRIPRSKSLTDSSQAFPSIATINDGLTLTKSPKMFKDKMKENALRTPNQFERLSGSLDFMASGGVFPDRTTIVHPVAVCVRCAGNAAMCMPCTELLCQESLTFYRKTRAIGAASLFQRAVTEAGLTKLMKFAVFKLWLNYLKKIKILRVRREKGAEKLFFMKGAQIPFFAWRSFVKTEVLERKDKTIQELRERISAMEGTFSRVQFEKANTAKQIKQLQSDLSSSEREVKSNQKIIESLEKTISIEQSRVVGLCAMARPVMILTKLVDDVRDWNISDLNNDYISSRKNNITGHDFSRIFLDEQYISSLIKKQIKQQSARSSSSNNKYTKEISGENIDVEFMLLKWANSMIEESGLLIEKNSKKYLEAFLPVSDVPRSFPDFSDGFQLARIIIGLIVQAYIYQSPHESLDDFYPTIEEFDIAKKAKNSTEKILPIVLNLGIKYLSLPIFKAEDIIDGKVEIIRALITYLFLIASPSRFNDDNETIAKEVSDFKDLLENIDEIKEETKRKDALIEMHNVWAAMTSTDTSTDTTFKPRDIMEELSEAANNLDMMSESKGENDVPLSENAENEEVSENKDGDIELPDKAPETKSLVVYTELSDVVDKFLSSDAQMLPTMAIKTGQTMYKLKTYKERVKITIDNENKGNKLGRLIRSHVIKHWSMNMLKDVKLVSEE